MNLGGPPTPVKRLGVHLVLIALAFAFAAPLLWMVATSIKPAAQAMKTPPTLLPEPVSRAFEYAAANYSAVWNDPVIDFPLFLRNSLVVSLLNVVGMTLSSAIAAYGFSRVQWRGRGVVFAVLLATLMIPDYAAMNALLAYMTENCCGAPAPAAPACEC